MNDRELLELAARAAGIEWIAHTDLIGGAPALRTSVTVAPLGMWAPLVDDGDAQRLTVKLGLEVSVRAKTAAAHLWTDGGEGGPTYALEFFSDDDPYAATRRAIVRAAAAIGRTLPPSGGNVEGEKR